MLTTDAVGGVWNYTMSLARGLADSGSDCTVVVLGPPPKQAQFTDALIGGIRLVETSLDLDWIAQDERQLTLIAQELATLGQRLGVDLAHLHTPVFAVGTWTVPVVSVAHSCVATWWAAVHHTAMPASLDWRRQAMEAGLTKSDAVIAPSAAFATALAKVYGHAGASRVIYNGHVPSCSSTAGAGPANFVMSAGRLWDAGKNMRTLDETAILQPHPIMAVGEVAGPDGSRFCGRNLSAPGVFSKRALADAYAQAALFAAPSLYEPFGLAVLEAASAGLPLLLADIPTFRELWSDAAVFVPPRLPANWADAIHRLMEDRPERMRLGARARARSLCYTRDRMVRRTRALHDAVLAARRDRVSN